MEIARLLRIRRRGKVRAVVRQKVEEGEESQRPPCGGERCRRGKVSVEESAVEEEK
jgi:hypothetical protein